MSKKGRSCDKAYVTVNAHNKAIQWISLKSRLPTYRQEVGEFFSESYCCLHLRHNRNVIAATWTGAVRDRCMCVV